MTVVTVVKRVANQHGAWVTLDCGCVIKENGCWPMLKGNTYESECTGVIS